MHNILFVTDNDNLYVESKHQIQYQMTAINFLRLPMQQATTKNILDKDPDLIITDYDPFLADWQADLKKNHPDLNIPIITLIEHKSDYLPQYSDFTLNKPLNSQILIQLIKNLASQSNQQMELNRLVDIFQYEVFKINSNNKVIQTRLTADTPFKPEDSVFLDKHISEIFPESFISILEEKLVKVQNSYRSMTFQYSPSESLQKTWYQVNLIPHKQSTTTIVLKDITHIKSSVQIHNAQFEIARAVTASPDLNTLYKKIHAALNKILVAESFYIAIENPETGDIISPYFYDERYEVKTPLTLNNNGISNYILKTKKSLYVDEEVRNYLIASGKIRDYTSKSKVMLGVPLMVDDAAIGIIAIRSFSEKVIYNHTHLELLEFISIQIATAISQKQAEKKILKAYSEKDALLKELYHRTKNNMQVIISMLSIQAHSTDSEYMKEKFKNISNRIATMSLAQEKLYKSQSLTEINLAEYIADLVTLLTRNNHRLGQPVKRDLDIANIKLNIDIILPLGLAINELISNSYRHAFKENSTGSISLKIVKLDENHIEVTYSDDGCGLPADFDSEKSLNMGLRNLYSIIKHQLKGTVVYENKNGLTWKIIIQDNLYTDRI